MRYTVGIVGGGPIGLLVAGGLAERGVNTVVFEEHENVGLPLHCAGLVTSRVLSLTPFPSENLVLNRIKGAVIHSPLGYKLSIGGDRIHALAIDRIAFDKAMMNYAIEKGADVFLNNKVEEMRSYNDEIKIKTSKEELSSRFLIGADGAASIVRRVFNFPQPMEYLKCIGVNLLDTSFNPNYVEIFLGLNIAPGFFAWIIPITPRGTEARIGLCVNRDKLPPKHYLDKLLNHPEVQRGTERSTIINYTGGIIPLGPLKKTVKSNILLVGDAAAQVKPTSGGGLYPGLSAAKYCIDAISRAVDLKTPVLIEKALQNYHLSWMKDIGRELLFDMKLRNVFLKLTDDKIDAILRKIDQPIILETISKYGDIDYPSKLVRYMIRNHPLKAASFLPYLFRF
ncbi:MAG: hypothetical protein DRN12_00085 [Thermoplasmata archaeon]|nr:MAG: hypothetical protein DRN12_00085 [Thermoplasmata archaeon]